MEQGVSLIGGCGDDRMSTEEWIGLIRAALETAMEGQRRCKIYGRR